MTFTEYNEWQQDLFDKLLKNPERDEALLKDLKDFRASIDASIAAYAHSIDAMEKTISTLNKNTAQLCILRNTILKEISRLTKKETHEI